MYYIKEVLYMISLKLLRNIKHIDAISIRYDIMMYIHIYTVHTDCNVFIQFPSRML